MSVRLACLLALGAAVATAPSVARAEIQKEGAQQWPGKFQVGFHPFGVQARFDGLSTGGYHMDIDFAVKIRELEKLTIWLGGGFDWTHPSYSCGFNLAGCAYDLQLWGFVMVTLEKLMRIPLVPLVQAGIAADILPYPTVAGTLSGGALSLRIGAGLHYYLIKNLGVGAETHFALGPGFYPAAVINNGSSGTNVALYGNWDLVFGARAAF